MLKQPLALRLLRPKGVAHSSVESTAPKTDSLASDSSKLDSSKLGSSKLDGSKSDSPEPDSPEPDSLKPNSSESDSSTLDSSKSDDSKQPQRSTFRRVSLGCAVLSALTGFAFTQSWPDTIQTKLQPDPAKAPLRQAGDPSAVAPEKVADLFLTHQIFYRKLEAMSGAAIASTPAAAQSAAAKPEPQPEKVTAAAPPAPAAAEPVAFSGTTIDSVLEMRVALARDVDAIAFSTSHGGTLADLDGNSLKTLAPDTASLAKINGSIVVDGETMPSAFWIYPDDGGYVAIGSSWYRGRVLIALRERGLIAVNYVLLGDYLYSVVGTEVSSSWPIESIKAQAVAARSYALTHNIRPASEAYFDLDNTQRFQAYKGISREDSITQAAVLATAGEFISYEGGIVESLYAASQEIVDDAHKGSGMSQLGAKDLAEQGYSYQEILAHYYPGTALGRIETDQN